MSVNEIEVALLKQQVEFLTLELEDGKAREANLKNLNDSLLEALTQTDDAEVKVNYEQTIEDLTKTKDLLLEDCTNLKNQLQRAQAETNEQAAQLLQAKKDMKHKLKQLKAASELSIARLNDQLSAKAQELTHFQAQAATTLQLKEEEWLNERTALLASSQTLHSQLDQLQMQLTGLQQENASLKETQQEEQ